MPNDPLPTMSTIHMFWHGSPLSRVEYLCLSSFVYHGHRVNLHAYNDVGRVPSGVDLVDAAETLSEELIFLHKRTGSIALFADWFRYKLLYERGGIWVDTDIVCLKPFVFSEAVTLGLVTQDLLNNAVIGMRSAHPLAKWMADCCESPNKVLPYDPFATRVKKLRRRYLEGNKRQNIGWGEYGPKGLTHAAKYFGVFDIALPVEAFYPVSGDDWHTIFTSDSSCDSSSFASSYGLHLWNNMMRGVAGFNKNDMFPESSIFERLWSTYVRES